MAGHSIEVSEEGGVRYLHFGSPWVQGAMRIARPYALELEYTQAMMFALLFKRAPRRVLCIGLGAGSVVKFLYRHVAGAHITVVEIDARIEPVARREFLLPQDAARIDIVIEDGVAYLKRTRERFDLILVDGFDAKARAGALDSEAFYTGCHAALTDAGLLVVNLFGRVARFSASVRRLRNVFGARVVTLPECKAGNVVALARRGGRIQTSATALLRAAQALKAHTGLDLSQLAKRLLREQESRPGLAATE